MKKLPFRRLTAGFLIVLMLAGQPFTPHAQAQEPAKPSAVLTVDGISLPDSFGRIEKTFKGNTPKTVILIQDAHAIPDAQLSIQKITRYFERKYGIRTVALEGASRGLDPQFFRSFPDQKLLKKIFHSLHEKGELAGGAAAAIFNSGPAQYQGIEDWNLYEQGVKLYVQAMNNEGATLESIKKLKEKVEKRRQDLNSKELRELDAVLENFYGNKTGISEILEKLARYQTPDPQSDLGLLYKKIHRNPIDHEKAAAEVKKAAEVLEIKLKSKNITPEGRRRWAKFNESYQVFLTGQSSPENFANFLKAFLINEKLSVPEVIKNLAGEEQRVRNIQGTDFFNQFEDYVRQVKEKLFQNDEQRALDFHMGRLKLLERFVKLEISHKDWQDISSWSAGKEPVVKNGIRLPEDSIPLERLENAIFESAGNSFAFYENALNRDRVLFTNLKKILEKSSSSIFVAGGFHTEGVTKLMREEGISYALLMPVMKNIPEETNYRAHMKGDVSWKEYLKPEKDGRVALYNSFLRAMRDKLLQNDKALLKIWRDQIIRDLAKQNRLEDAGEYTVFLDELSFIDKPKNKTIEAAQKFIADLRLLHQRNEYTPENIAGLLKPSMSIGLEDGTALLQKGSTAFNPYTPVELEAVAVRPEIRTLGRREFLAAVTAAAALAFLDLKNLSAQEKPPVLEDLKTAYPEIDFKGFEDLAAADSVLAEETAVAVKKALDELKKNHPSLLAPKPGSTPVFEVQIWRGQDLRMEFSKTNFQVTTLSDVPLFEANNNPDLWVHAAVALVNFHSLTRDDQELWYRLTSVNARRRMGTLRNYIAQARNGKWPDHGAEVAADVGARMKSEKMFADYVSRHFGLTRNAAYDPVLDNYINLLLVNGTVDPQKLRAAAAASPLFVGLAIGGIAGLIGLGVGAYFLFRDKSGLKLLSGEEGESDVLEYLYTGKSIHLYDIAERIAKRNGLQRASQVRLKFDKTFYKGFFDPVEPESSNIEVPKGSRITVRLTNPRHEIRTVAPEEWWLEKDLRIHDFYAMFREPVKPALRAFVQERILPLLSGLQGVVEIGAGPKRTFRSLAGEVPFNWEETDWDQGVLDKMAEAALPFPLQTRVVDLKAPRLPYEDNTVPAYISLAALDTIPIPELDRIFEEFARTLAPGAPIVIMLDLRPNLTVEVRELKRENPNFVLFPGFSEIKPNIFKPIGAIVVDWPALEKAYKSALGSRPNDPIWKMMVQNKQNPEKFLIDFEQSHESAEAMLGMSTVIMQLNERNPGIVKRRIMSLPDLHMERLKKAAERAGLQVLTAGPESLEMRDFNRSEVSGVEPGVKIIPYWTGNLAFLGHRSLNLPRDKILIDYSAHIFHAVKRSEIRTADQFNQAVEELYNYVISGDETSKGLDYFAEELPGVFSRSAQMKLSLENALRLAEQGSNEEESLSVEDEKRRIQEIRRFIALVRSDPNYPRPEKTDGPSMFRMRKEFGEFTRRLNSMYVKRVDKAARAEVRTTGEVWVPVQINSELAEKLAGIDHPSIPKYRLNPDNRTPEMLRVVGPRMDQWLSRHKRIEQDEMMRQIIAWELQVADAMAVLHENGIQNAYAHPQDIAIDVLNRPVLVNFGDEVGDSALFLYSFVRAAMQSYGMKKFSKRIDPLWLKIEKILGASLKLLTARDSYQILKLYYDYRWPTGDTPAAVRTQEAETGFFAAVTLVITGAGLRSILDLQSAGKDYGHETGSQRTVGPKFEELKVIAGQIMGRRDAMPALEQEQRIQTLLAEIFDAPSEITNEELSNSQTLGPGDVVAMNLPLGTFYPVGTAAVILGRSPSPQFASRYLIIDSQGNYTDIEPEQLADRFDFIVRPRPEIRTANRDFIKGTHVWESFPGYEITVAYPSEENMTVTVRAPAAGQEPALEVTREISALRNPAGADIEEILERYLRAFDASAKNAVSNAVMRLLARWTGVRPFETVFQSFFVEFIGFFQTPSRKRERIETAPVPAQKSNLTPEMQMAVEISKILLDTTYHPIIGDAPEERSRRLNQIRAEAGDKMFAAAVTLLLQRQSQEPPFSGVTRERSREESQASEAFPVRINETDMRDLVERYLEPVLRDNPGFLTEELRPFIRAEIRAGENPAMPRAEVRSKQLINERPEIRKKAEGPDEAARDFKRWHQNRDEVSRSTVTRDFENVEKENFEAFAEAFLNELEKLEASGEVDAEFAQAARGFVAMLSGVAKEITGKDGAVTLVLGVPPQEGEAAQKDFARTQAEAVSKLGPQNLEGLLLDGRLNQILQSALEKAGLPKGRLRAVRDLMHVAVDQKTQAGLPKISEAGDTLEKQGAKTSGKLLPILLDRTGAGSADIFTVAAAVFLQYFVAYMAAKELTVNEFETLVKAANGETVKADEVKAITDKLLKILSKTGYDFADLISMQKGAPSIMVSQVQHFIQQHQAELAAAAAA